MSRDEWMRDIADDMYYRQDIRFKDIVYADASKRVIVVRYSLPLVSRQKSLGSIIALVDRTAIEDQLRQRLAAEEGFSYIVMEDGRLFAGVNETESAEMPMFSEYQGDSGIRYELVDGRTFAVSYYRSSYNGWLYVTGMPREVFLSEAIRIQMAFLLFAIVVIVVGIPVSIFLAYGSTKPILDIVRILGTGGSAATDQRHDALRYISESVSTLISRNSSLGRLLEEQKPILKNLLIERLFRGDFATEEELKAHMEHFGLEICGRYFGVFCVFIDGYYDEVDSEIIKEFIVKNSLVRERIAGVLQDRTLVHEISLNKIGVITSFDDVDKSSNERQFDELLLQVVDQISSYAEVRCLFARGPLAESLLEVSSSLENAIRKLAVASVAEYENGIVPDAVSSDGMYYYPIEIETRIMNLVLNGHPEELVSLLENTERENFEKRHLSVRVLRVLAEEVEGTKAKIEERLAVSDLALSLENSGSDRSLRDRIVSLFGEFVRYAECMKGRRSQPHKLRQPILEHIKRNFSNPDICLKSLALHFKLSEVYFSHLFRELTDSNFSCYLENLRMEEALRLLRSGRNHTVDHIADSVGYRSSQVFRRAFKKRYGISPSLAAKDENSL